MAKLEYRPRIVDKETDDAFQTFGALCIEGPKWCGKTRTSEFHAKSKIGLGDPTGNFQNRKLAEMDPSLILEGEAPRLIDEWQEIPGIWDAVRFQVDERAEKGQFIITNSSTPKRKGVLHSGAGRIAKLRMLPMTLFESGASSGKISLLDICTGNFKSAMTGEVKLKEIIEQIVRGGWPGNLELSTQQAIKIPKAYIDAIIEMPNGEWNAFEIKLGANQIDEAAANLLSIRDDIAKDPKGKPPSHLCVICGLSNAAYKRPDGVYVVPITALKN